MKRLVITIGIVLALAAPVFAQDVAVSDNPEMAAILAADRAVREDVAAVLAGGRENAMRIAAEDAVRRQQVRALLDAGALRTAADFDSAAWVFQHGDTSDDNLMAHTLALAALGKGSTESTWIAAETLDRYLQMVGQQQIYGTQRMVRRGQQPTRAPYNHTLIPDTLLTALGVSTRPSQEAREQAQTQHEGSGTQE